MQTQIDRIRNHLEQRFSPTHLNIEDDSHHHAGHAGAQQGGHFNVLIVSAVFEGQSLIKRHRMVFEALEDLMQTDIHALSINARTPQEFKP